MPQGAGGLFNIVAVTSQNAEGCIFPVQKDIMLPTYQLEDEYKLLTPKREFEDKVDSSELLSRAWVYQEVLFCSSS